MTSLNETHALGLCRNLNILWAAGQWILRRRSKWKCVKKGILSFYEGFKKRSLSCGSGVEVSWVSPGEKLFRASYHSINPRRFNFLDTLVAAWIGFTWNAPFWCPRFFANPSNEWTRDNLLATVLNCT